MALIRSIRRYGMNDLWYYTRLLWMTIPMKASVHKLPNVVRCALDWKTGRTTVRSRPPLVRIEASGICNLRCLSCTTAKKHFSPGQIRMMEFDWFKTIYSQLAPYACRVTFYIAGEPMTNPRLFDMVKFASHASVFTSLCTNFTLMKRDLLQPLVDSKLDWLSVCLDGFTQEAFQKYRVHGDVSRVKEAITMVTEYKKLHHLRRPFLNVYTITFKHVLPELPLIIAFCKECGVDQLTFRPDESNTYGDDVASPKSTSRLPLSSCFWPWTAIHVDVDGSVYPCPQAYYTRASQRAQGSYFSTCESKPYGSLLKASLDEVWNNSSYTETRKYLSGNGQKKPSLDLPCHSCPAYGPKR